MIISFVTGHFRGSPVDYPIEVKVAKTEITIMPTTFVRLLRRNRPLLHLALGEIKLAKKTAYRAWWPMPAIEIEYEKQGEKKAFVIGFYWRRQQFVQTLEKLGIPVIG